MQNRGRTPLFIALNECAYPPSPRVATSIAAQLGQLSRYADPADAGRLTANLAAAAAAVEDTTRAAGARAANLAARERLHVAIDALGLKRSASRGNFVLFRSPVGGDTLRARLIAGGIVPAHAFAPLNEWVRITVGNDAEVTRTIAVLRAALV